MTATTEAAVPASTSLSEASKPETFSRFRRILHTAREAFRSREPQKNIEPPTHEETGNTDSGWGRVLRLVVVGCWSVVVLICWPLQWDLANPNTVALIWLPIVLAPLMLFPLDLAVVRNRTAQARIDDLNTNIEALNTVGGEKDSYYSRFSLASLEVRYLLASVDKFVDEAQRVLTGRATAYYVAGTVSFLGSFGVLHLAGLLAWITLHELTPAMMKDLEHPTHFVILRIFAALALATAVYAIIKALISFGSSFLHEATRLLDRRHALRFGRLYMYLTRENFDFSDMEGAFQWHRESQTVFQQISAGKITEGSISQVLKTVTEAAEAAAKLRAVMEPPKKEK